MQTHLKNGDIEKGFYSKNDSKDSHYWGLSNKTREYWSQCL